MQTSLYPLEHKNFIFIKICEKNSDFIRYICAPTTQLFKNILLNINYPKLAWYY